MSNPLPFPLLYIILPIAALICGGLIGYAVSGLRRMPPATTYGIAATPPTDAPITPPPESWAMKNTDKLLIAGLLVFNMLITLYVGIGNDAGQIQFFNNLTSNLSICLLTLVGGAVLRKTTDTTVTKDPDSGRTMGITTVRDEEK